MMNLSSHGAKRSEGGVGRCPPVHPSTSSQPRSRYRVPDWPWYSVASASMSPESTSIECVVEVAADTARDSPTKLARGRPLTGALAQHGLHGLTNARCHRLADIRVTLK